MILVVMITIIIKITNINYYYYYYYQPMSENTNMVTPGEEFDPIPDEKVVNIYNYNFYNH